ncbi:alpha/beta hydrolase family protein [Actinokineospora fastidiosa]|uniref:PET hydrolase/cutinase-like domain-containing protein n=1 Tax=Actinokineospora fastidiosa TaxID=1816 RepID=A0A918LED6_9PSEU|nr:acetylxylan esterase [Actinokineospora fastidiosa]GGS35905.1 hypothetical protein GCM10010171_33160 [Actinokineospora fastidiosa]
MTSRSLRRGFGLSAIAVALVVAQAPGFTAVASPATAAAVERHYEQPGPHAVTKAPGGPAHTLYYPADIASSTVPHPVLVWGNGTNATVDQYDQFLRHIASWGIVVAAANTGRAGSGEEMLAGAHYLISENSRPGSVFHGKINPGRVGAAGHSQGGGGAIAAGADPLITVTAPVQPGPQGSVPMLQGPALFIAGQLDYIVPSFYVRGRYARAGHVPAVFAELRGSDHFFPGETRTRLIGVLTAWFRYWLADDTKAKTVFFGPEDQTELYLDTAAWSSVDRNTKATAIG